VLPQATINLRRYYVGFFLTDGLRHRCAPSDLARLHPHVIHRYVTRVSAPLRCTSKQHVSNSIRSFLRFAQVRGWADMKLRAAVPVISTSTDARLPMALSWQDVNKLLAAPDRRTRIGKRDYAILQLIANYGVRIGQAMRLKSADIDWRNGTIRFAPSKNGRDLVFPLLATVAKAILDYLRARGSAPYPDVFLASPPGGRAQRPFGTWTHLNDNIAGYYAKAGITAPRVGFHAV
jgi:integrase/recombinase XerD